MSEIKGRRRRPDLSRQPPADLSQLSDPNLIRPHEDRPCRHRANPEDLAKPPESFIGRFVMLDFPIGDTGYKERMWVRVVGLAEGKDGELRGRLCNTPLYPVNRTFGELFDFNRREIVGLLPRLEEP